MVVFLTDEGYAWKLGFVFCSTFHARALCMETRLCFLLYFPRKCPMHGNSPMFSALLSSQEPNDWKLGYVFCSTFHARALCMESRLCFLLYFPRKCLMRGNSAMFSALLSTQERNTRGYGVILS